jgi:hypothetical protein
MFRPQKSINWTIDKKATAIAFSMAVVRKGEFR